MRLLAAVILLAFSGSFSDMAFGDAPMQVKTKAKKDHHYQAKDAHRHHKGHGYRHERHPHHLHDGYDHRRVEDREWSIWINLNGPGLFYHRRDVNDAYRDRHYYSRIVHDYRANDWITAHWFSASARHGREHGRDQVIYIGARVTAIRLKGRHRDASVHRAYAELANGRIIPLHALQGHVAHGKRKGRYFYFDRPRHVVRVFLGVDSAHRHKPAQIALGYVSAERHR